MWSALADAVLVIHLGFVAFVLLGALLCLKWPRLAWFHVPSVLWSVWVNLMGWVCPLTPLEITLRRWAGEGFFEGSFIAYYIAPLVYVGEPTPALVMALAGGIAAWNLMLYTLVYRIHGRGG